MSSFIKIGQTLKPHGLKGELKLKIEMIYLEALMEAPALFIDQKGTPAPFFVEELQEGNHLIICLEGVGSRSAAEPLAHSAVYLRKEDINLSEEEMHAKGMAYKHLEGFLLVDEELGEIAQIEEVISYPQQEIAYLNYEGKEVMIPLHPSLIVEVDKANKLLRMNLPEGILSI